jgi:ABC-2 type transport system ATP-binding protein
VSLTLRNVSIRFGQVYALKQIDLTFDRGVTAILGVNGAGKSTLLAVAAGLLAPDTGSATVLSEDLFDRRSRKKALAQVAIMPQFAHFPRTMTASEVVAYMGWLKGLDAKSARQRAADSLDQVGLRDVADRKMRTLSGGMQRRVALAQAVAASPKVLLLDEPSTGLDPAQRRAMIELVRGQPGAVILSSHIVEDVAELATRIVVLDQGRVLFDGTPAALEARAVRSPRRGRNRLEAGFLSLINASITP